MSGSGALGVQEAGFQGGWFSWCGAQICSTFLLAKVFPWHKERDRWNTLGKAAWAYLVLYWSDVLKEIAWSWPWIRILCADERYSSEDNMRIL
jgi:hypothetical protein